VRDGEARVSCNADGRVILVRLYRTIRTTERRGSGASGNVVSSSVTPLGCRPASLMRQRAAWRTSAVCRQAVETATGAPVTDEVASRRVRHRVAGCAACGASDAALS
jgi:hypothetical protein